MRLCIQTPGGAHWPRPLIHKVVCRLPACSAVLSTCIPLDIEKNEWSDDKIEYDEQEGFEDSEGKASEAFDDKGNTIGNYDDFEGSGSTDIVSFGSSYGPSAITITYENDKKIVFEFSSRSWTVEIADGKPEAVGDDEAVLLLVRKLLK